MPLWWTWYTGRDMEQKISTAAAIVILGVLAIIGALYWMERQVIIVPAPQ